MKRLFLVIVAAFMLFMNVPSSYAAKDDITGHYFEKEMRTLIGMGILGGYEPGIYKPDNTVTRAEFAALVVRTLDLHPAEAAEFSIASAADPQFKDVLPGQWFYADVEAAVKAGIVKGYNDGTFLPGNAISRQEMAEMIKRALESRSVYSMPATLTFKDKDKINPIFLDAVQRLVFLDIMRGNADQTFGPLSKTTRGQTAAVLSRMINAINPPKGLEYKVAVINSDGTPTVIREFDDFASAKTSAVDSQVVLKGNKIAYIKSGVAAANKFTVIFANPNLTGTSITYVATGTEFKYFDATETSVKIQVAGTVGYVAADSVNLIPSSLVKDRSYYKQSGGNVSHYVYNPLTKAYEGSILLGKAPAFMAEGQSYYSWDGINFNKADGTKAGEAHNYFANLPLHTKTNYTAEEIDRYLTEQYPASFKAKIPVSPLAGLGKDFKDMEAKYEVNALYLMAHAIHESGWGTSEIAQVKKNLYGMKAYDNDPLNNAVTYATFRDSIEDAAKKVSREYHAPKGTYYHGAVLGSKSVGMNVKYASDPFWGEKIAGHMYRADSFLGKKDQNAYPLAYNTIPSLNVRTGYGTSNTIIYEMKITGIPFIYTETAQKDGATWYKIISDDIANRTGHVYGKGSFGEYVKLMQVPK